VVSALCRRVPHVQVVIAPAAVQGAGAPAELAGALEALYALDPPVDAILLVRGGGSIEDLWAFNDETLAHTIARSPVPVVSGVGHETDFTIADFVADLRAPTPTAAAELVAAPRDTWLGALDLIGRRLADGLDARLGTLGQRLDMAAARLGRPSNAAARQRVHLTHEAQRLRYAVMTQRVRLAQREEALRAALPTALAADVTRRRERLERAAARLRLLDPAHVLQRGYAWLADERGRAITSVRQAVPGEAVSARLADGELPLTVAGPARSPALKDGR
jgi:exodeoxyribonuclease VII large subunit